MVSHRVLHMRISLVMASISFVILAGCQPKAIKPLDPNSNASILEYHKPVVDQGHKDYALRELERGTLFFELGDYCDADVRLANACRVMDEITGNKTAETTAVLWAESSKPFKGAPHERATAYFYRGLCRYRMNDYSGALAAFRHSLACDGETRSKNQKDLEDFCISHVMAAMCYLQLNEPENAEAALRLAGLYLPEASKSYLTVDRLNRNFVLILGVGFGPFLKPSSWDVSIKSVECLPNEEAGVEVCVDDKSVGKAIELTDLYTQAKSQSWGDMDTVRVAKAVGTRAVSYIPVVGGLLAHAVRSEADLRCWLGLPRKFYLVSADLPQGQHTVSLRFTSPKEADLENYTQVWFDVPVSGPSNLYFLKCIKYYQNCHGLEPHNITANAIPTTSGKGDTR